MKNVWVLKSIGAFALMGMFFLASCGERFEFTSNDSASVENEAATDGYFEDTDDMSMVALSTDNAAASGERSGAKPADLRFACATVTVVFESDNTSQQPHGIMTIDFGTGCTDIRGNTRKGKIIVEFNGRRFLPGSTIVATLDGYEINGVKLEGVRTVTNVNGSTEENPKFSIVLAGGKATWANGSATREVNRTREWVRKANPLEDEWIVEGSAAGTNREGKVYAMTITKPLVYKRECAVSSRVFMAVQGSKDLVVEGRKITIDYGTGTCDRTVMITMNGKTKEVEVRGDI